MVHGLTIAKFHFVEKNHVDVWTFRKNTCILPTKNANLLLFKLQSLPVAVCITTARICF